MERLAGRYDLREEVARGRGRTLWRGHDTVLDRPVGVLLLDAGHPHSEEVRRAAQLAASVEHAGMLRVIDTAEDQGRVFVVTRWLAGTPLSEQLAVGPLTPDEARYVVRSVADALAEAAKEGVHHLVLDPNDVLLTDHGVVVVGITADLSLETNRLQPGDVIHRLNQQTILNLDALRAALESCKHGQPVALHIERAGQFQFLLVEID